MALFVGPGGEEVSLPFDHIPLAEPPTVKVPDSPFVAVASCYNVTIAGGEFQLTLIDGGPIASARLPSVMKVHLERIADGLLVIPYELDREVSSVAYIPCENIKVGADDRSWGEGVSKYDLFLMVPVKPGPNLSLDRLKEFLAMVNSLLDDPTVLTKVGIAVPTGE